MKNLIARVAAVYGAEYKVGDWITFYEDRPNTPFKWGEKYEVVAVDAGFVSVGPDPYVPFYTIRNEEGQTTRRPYWAFKRNQPALKPRDNIEILTRTMVAKLKKAGIVLERGKSVKRDGRRLQVPMSLMKKTDPIPMDNVRRALASEPFEPAGRNKYQVDVQVEVDKKDVYTIELFPSPLDREMFAYLVMYRTGIRVPM